ncbi:SDR family oxidoreductase [Flectobacillus major]|jgi:short-subunit dehydrogenase|uniref:SDR family oxidoreductase n=1 Tax=Flectobacillus major TaxID=103 RepID=UPI000419ADF3|nr:SDR family oxidoreductase [Flectobacillus major]
MSGYLQHKVIWITGASSGIGEALAYQFAQSDVKLILSARRENELQRVANRCGLLPENILVLPMDMLEIDQLAVKVQAAINHFGQIDIVVQNAGVSQRSLIKDTQLSVYRDLMELNYFSIVALTKALLPHFTQRRQGHFVAISSIAGKIGTPLRSGYGPTKHAVIAFCDSLRAEIFRDNILVTVICPGYIKTAISLNALSGDGSKHGQMDDNQAKGLSAEECAKSIVKAIVAQKNEVYIGGWFEVLGVYLKRFWPALVYRIVRKVNA